MDELNLNNLIPADTIDLPDAEQQKKNAAKRADIIRNTPCGEDPVLYWHQVAMDAVHSADRERQRSQDARNENDALKRYQASENARIHRELQRQTMPSVRELIGRVEHGDFSMNIQFSFYPNTERKETSYDGYED